MKFAKITHIRCSEPDGTTYCFVPDEWTEEQFEGAVYRAEKFYQGATNAYLEELKKGDLHQLANYWGHGSPNYDRYPDKTVAEVKEAFEKEKAEKLRRKMILDQARRSFSDFLAKEGLTVFYNAEADFEVEVHWGHQHGVPLQYREDTPYELDKQGAGFATPED